MGQPLGPLPAGQPRGALLAEVARVLSHLADGVPVVVACSGGPDSSALAHLSAEARPDLALHLVHVRHGLRDDQHDLEVVRTHAAWLDVPLSILDVEVVPEGRGIEAAARDARYAALRTVAARDGAAAVLVGHTADDQAETVLLRLARGTGIDGLAGMQAVSGDLVRPLLRLRREDVHGFVRMEGLPYAEDPTNVDPQVRRTIVRHRLLPALRDIAPDPVGALARLASLARDDAAALDAAARPWLAEVRRVGPVRAIADAVVDRPGASGANVALARRVVRAVLTELVGEPPDAATVARVLTLAPGSAASLPGPVEVTAAGGWRAFAPRTLPRGPRRPVHVPGTTAWPPADAEVVAVGPEHAPDGVGADEATGQVTLQLPGAWVPPPPDASPTLFPPGAHPAWLVIALPDDVGPLHLRHREPGDQVTTAGGTRTLQDVLVDAGVPRPIRELWPVVVDDAARIVWVPGYAADDAVLRAGRRAPAFQLRLVAATSTSPGSRHEL